MVWYHADVGNHPRNVGTPARNAKITEEVTCCHVLGTVEAPDRTHLEPHIEREKEITEESPFVRESTLTDHVATEKVEWTHAPLVEPGRLDSGSRGLPYLPSFKDEWNNVAAGENA